MITRAAMGKVLVVGTGLTGAVTASLLRENLPISTQIHIWDKSRGAGKYFLSNLCWEVIFVVLNYMLV